jgi:four helix bundle protein
VGGGKGMKSRKHRTSNIEHRTPNEFDLHRGELRENGNSRRKFNLEERLFEFACAIIDLCERLPNSRAGNHVAGQMLRSGTSTFPNHGEAESAESSEDFIHKLRLCLKELRETRRWAKLIERQRWVQDNAKLIFALNESEELIRIFVSSIRTARQNALQQSRRSTGPRSYPSGEGG